MMFFMRLLCIAPLHLLALTPPPELCQPNASSQYVSSLLESLQCYNDYTSHIGCMWTESPEARRLEPLSLYHMDTKGRVSPCVSDSLLGAHPGNRGCQYNTTLFAISIKHSFFFKTPLPPSISKALNLSQHVKVRSPAALSQQAAHNGSCLLQWSSPLPFKSPLYPTLSYQVAYRRPGHTWRVLDVSQMETTISMDSLVSGSSYEARVRARAGGGLWSEWSPLVQWQTEEARGPEGPSNLQCLSDGDGTVSCSWELKRHWAQSISYDLFYRTNSSMQPKRCCGTLLVTIDPRDPVLKFSCSFSVQPTEELWIELTPTHITKKFNSHHYIYPSPPSPVQLKEDGQDWLLTWTAPNSNSKLALSYEVRYWDSEPQNATYCNFSESSYWYRLYRTSLRPSTHYWAQVRVLPTGSFSGKPSKWSESVEWTTPPAPWSTSTLIYIFIGGLVTILFTALFVSLPAFHRKIVSWEVSLPSPIKSKVLEEILKRSPSGWMAPHREAERARICHVQVLDKAPPPSFSDIDWYSFSSTHSLYEEKRDRDTSDVSFNGPYLLCPTMSQSLDSLCKAGTQPSAEDSLPKSSSVISQLSLSLGEVATGYVKLPLSAGITAPSSDVNFKPDGYVVCPLVPGGMPRPERRSGHEFPDCDPPAYTPAPPILFANTPGHMSEDLRLLMDSRAEQTEE